MMPYREPVSESTFLNVVDGQAQAAVDGQTHDVFGSR